MQQRLATILALSLVAVSSVPVTVTSWPAVGTGKLVEPGPMLETTSPWLWLSITSTLLSVLAPINSNP